MPAFHALPTELILHILLSLDIGDLLNVSETSRSLLTLCRSDDIWKPKSKALWRSHGLGGKLIKEEEEGWPAWKSLYGPYGKYLGVYYLIISQQPQAQRHAFPRQIRSVGVTFAFQRPTARRQSDPRQDRPVGCAVLQRRGSRRSAGGASRRRCLS